MSACAGLGVNFCGRTVCYRPGAEVEVSREQPFKTVQTLRRCGFPIEVAKRLVCIAFE